jgi:hypothetical protein
LNKYDILKRSSSKISVYDLKFKKNEIKCKQLISRSKNKKNAGLLRHKLHYLKIKFYKIILPIYSLTMQYQNHTQTLYSLLRADRSGSCT